MYKTFKPNEYVDFYNPTQYNYFPVRILSKSDKGYNTLTLQNKKEREFYQYAIDTYRNKKNYITRELLLNAGFKKDNLKYTKDNITVKFPPLPGQKI